MLTELVDTVCRMVAGQVPYPPLQEFAFLQRAFVGLCLIAPLCAAIGIQVVNFRLAFFAEAVGHSAFTGIAIGLVLSAIGIFGPIDPVVGMTAFGILVAMLITHYRGASVLPSDTVIGVFSATTIAVGLFVITHLIRANPAAGARARLNDFLLGNILTIYPGELAILFGLFCVIMGFECFAYNRLLLIGLNAPLAKTMGIWVRTYEYAYALVLALVVMFSVQAVGVLLVTAMLVVPAAAARNLARSAGAVFWWGLAIALSSAVGGLLLSDRFAASTGASVVLVSAAWFLASQSIVRLRGR